MNSETMSNLIGSSLPGDQVDFEEEPGDAEYYLMKRTIGVSKADWKVYEVISAAREEFMAKLKVTWAWGKSSVTHHHRQAYYIWR